MPLKNERSGLSGNYIDEFKSENRRLRDKRSGTEEMLQNEVQRQQLQISELTEKLEKAEKLLVWFRNIKFNRSSEKGTTAPKPAESDAQAKDKKGPTNKRNTSEPKKNRGQQPGSKGHGRSDRSELDTTIEYLEIPGGCACG